MILKGIVFDVNGTLTDIRTNEWHDDVYRVLSNLLSYQGISLGAGAVRDRYFQLMKEQRAACVDPYPEFDAVAIFGDIVTQHSSGFTRALPADKLAQLPVMLAQAHRAASRFRLAPYPGVEETLRQLHAKYRLAVVSDGQSAWAVPELHAVGLAGYFDPIVISGDFGYRKPDERLFSAALSAMNVAPSEALFVGNDTLRDVFGGHRLGMKTVFFESNQCSRDKDGVEPDYVIRAFPELLNAIRFFEGS